MNANQRASETPFMAGERAGAAKERRRIRAAQREAMCDLNRFWLTLTANHFGGWADSLKTIRAALDSATRAPRRKGRG